MKTLNVILTCCLLFISWYHADKAIPEHMLWRFIAVFGTIAAVIWFICMILDEEEGRIVTANIITPKPHKYD